MTRSITPTNKESKEAMATGKVLDGKPYAGKLHVRFDEGAGVPYGGVPLYSTPFWLWESRAMNILMK